jgi:hypothetical protein
MGSTYTRQSSYTDGDVIQASDTNDEFDQLLAAFAADTGHTHDGTTAEGGPITKLLGNTLTFGAGTAGTDITITFDGETNDGELKWMEDEDYFEFSDDILIASTEKLQFRDTAIYINSSTDGQLDIVADTEIQIAATTIDINGNVDISGTLTIGSAGISEAELEILDGANVTTAELNIMDGDTSATSTTVADADRVVFNDAGTMKQVAVTDLAAYFDDEITAMPNLVTTAATTVGALNSGSITSGFGTIDTGSSTITTTGLISGGSLDIDDVLINGTTIGHTDDTDLITLANGVVTVAGEVSMTTLDIGGTNVTSTAAELNIVDGGTSATSTTVADADRVVMNDNGTMVQVAVTDLAAYFDDEITAMPNLVTTAATTVGALNSGSITSGFGTIDTGSSNITTTGVGSFGSLDISGDIDVDGTTNLDVVDIDGAVDMASTLQLDGAITLGVAGASNGFINSPSGIFVNIDSDNNQTDRFFDIRKDSTDGSGTLLFQVLESGAATFNGNVSVSEANNTSSLVSARYNSSNRKIGFNVNNSNGQGFLAFNCNSVSGSGNQTYDTTGVAAKIDYTGDMTFDIAASGTAGNTISFSEAMRIDSDRKLLVGTTNNSLYNTSTQSHAGVLLDGVNDNLQVARYQGTPAFFNRLNNDGDIIDLRKDGASVGSIGVQGGDTYFAGTSKGIKAVSGFIGATNTTGVLQDNNTDLGSSSYRFKDLYLSGGIKIVSTDTTSAAAITFGDSADAATGSIGYFNSDDSLRFSGYNNQESMRIDSSGNLLLGTTSLNTGTLGAVNTFLEIAGDSGGSGTLILSRPSDTNAEEVAGIRFANANNADDDGLDADGKLIAGISARTVTSDSNAGDDAGGDLVFYTKPEAGNYAERMRLSSLGYTKITSTGTNINTNGRWHEIVGSYTGNVSAAIYHTSTTDPFGLFLNFPNDNPDDNSNYFIRADDSSTTRFFVYSDGDVVNHDNSYGAISDLKLKENIADAASQWDDIKAVRVRKYSMKSDNASEANRLGVIAQELEASGMGGLVKEAIDRDADNVDLGTTTKQVKYSVLYMKAIKALQEAIDRIETLEEKVATLEAN